MKKNFFKLVLALTAALTVLASCVDDKSALRFGFTTEPLTLDPLNPGNTAEGRSILFNVFEGLVKPGIDGKMMPCIAESWTIEENALVYNFILRDNVFFHDGTLLKAADVKFSLDTAIAAEFTGLDRISGVLAPSDNQIIITLKTPDTEFLPYLTTGIVKEGNNNREKNVIGTGPYLIEKYKTQRNLVLKKFDNYWQEGLPHLERVNIVFFENFDAMMIALRGGSIDGTQITGSMAAQLNRDNFDIIDSYSSAVQLLALNNLHPALYDIRVRQALNYGINIQYIIDAAFFGMGTPSQSPLIPGLSAYYENVNLYPYEPETAKALLAQAGYSENGRRLTLEITVPSNFTMHVDTAQVIASQLALIGVDTTIKLVDWNTWLMDVYFGRGYQATIISLDSPIVSPRSFISRYDSFAGDNFINFSSADFARVYTLILEETNEEKLIELYREAQRIIVQNAGSVFIQDILYFFAFRSGAYAGVLDYPLYVVDFASIYSIETD